LYRSIFLELGILYVVDICFLFCCVEGKVTTSGYVNFELFINALYELAIHSLSKQAFAEIYPTSESKITCMLNLWGLADSQRLQVINSKR
jgi:hypothetical protein